MIAVDLILERFSRHYLAMNRDPNSLAWIRCLLARFFSFAEAAGVKDLSEIDDRLLLKYQMTISEMKTKRGQTYAVTTQNMHLTALRGLFRFLRRAGDIESDPSLDIELARLPQRLPAGILGVAEVFKVIEQPDLSQATGIRDRAVLEVLYSSGIRRSELINLDLDDLNFELETLFIRQGKGRKDRVVPIGQFAKRWLGEYLAIRPTLTGESHTTGALFLSCRGRRIDKEAVRMIVKTHVQKSGITQRITPHSFRHMCATHLLDNGANVVHLQRLLGHACLNTTARYLQVSILGLKQAHARFHPRERMAREGMGPGERMGKP